MATDKKIIKVYVSAESEENLWLLYDIWAKRQVSRGLKPNKSKFIEMILKKYVQTEGIRILEERHNPFVPAERNVPEGEAKINVGE